MKMFALAFLHLVVAVANVEGFQSLLTFTTTRTRTSARTVQQKVGSSSAALPTLTSSGRPSFLPTTRQLLAPLSASTSSLSTTTTYDDTCDILVLGSGPAARAIASLLAADKTLDVLVSDQRIDSEWPPNYGVWKDEWEAVVERYALAGVQLQGGKVGHSIDREWAVTDCFFGGSFNIPVEERTRLDRPYCRVDRNALRNSLTDHTNYRTVKANHNSRAISVNLYEPAGSLVHDTDGTTIQLQTADGDTYDVRSKLVIDCTGHETKLVLRESHAQSTPPGFQIAYGVLVDVDESNSPDLSSIGPYDKEAMTLFDYRTDHFDATLQPKVSAAPTFIYAMPLAGNQIFFEETSLVARPAVSFQECKDRCIQRLLYHGIQVTAVHEEEFCYIPMGGALPAKDQRIIGLGGAAAMVHASTGYHLCRCMMGAADMAVAIRNELQQTQPNLDRAAASAYHAIWSPENIRQRNFVVFGGEFLMKQNVDGLRGFFDGFFRLPLALWGGFLAGWPGLPNNVNHETWWGRLWFGLSFIIKLPFPVAWDLFLNIVSYSLSEGAPLPQSVTPLLGAPNSYEYKPNLDGVGDVAAKQEARRMIQASTATIELPAAFDGSAGTVPERIAPQSHDVVRDFGSSNGAAAAESASSSSSFPVEAVPVREAIVQ